MLDSNLQKETMEDAAWLRRPPPKPKRNSVVPEIFICLVPEQRWAGLLDFLLVARCAYVCYRVYMYIYIYNHIILYIYIYYSLQYIYIHIILYNMHIYIYTIILYSTYLYIHIILTYILHTLVIKWYVYRVSEICTNWIPLGYGVHWRGE